ncbi:MAG: bifunctional phosphopantothenoylcysteine decarboxylase/phosphopantothenate--cysteine ligase CoaBC [Ruminococcus sp.]|nr:bifunctional phosphopantothenoylcysteine decarboxylase/phosphopantothenate--cysteine ligase CoaBC [Ruminococcus sp.]
MLKGKTVVLGVTASIAAYKIAGLASKLVKAGADVHVIMTKNAANFINPITFETLTGNKCMTDTFDRNFQFHVAHISIAERADVCLVAPASADVIAKMANGIADDMLTTTYLAMKCPVLVAPAMNTNMFTHPTVQENLRKLEKVGVTVISPDSGRLACGTNGVGKMPSEEVLFDYILREIAFPHDLAGRKVLVTAGPTQEAIDPVRFITNHSSGKMGYAIARNAMLRGAEVMLVSGPVSIQPPPFVKVISVVSAQDMFDVVKQSFMDMDIIIKSAAVADYTPINVSDEKIKKQGDGMEISLKRTADILSWLGKQKQEKQVLCGFSMETNNLVENSKEKLLSKNADLIAANSLSVEGSGFKGDTNKLTLIEKDRITELEMMTKEQTAGKLLDRLIEIYENKNV